MNTYEDLLQLNIGDISCNEPMSSHTTYRVGGEADYYVEVKSISALKRLVSYCREHEIKYMVVGRGSDLLFSDARYKGVIISLNKYFNICEVEKDGALALAGMSSIGFAYKTAEAGLSGFEFASGIPGTIGGGIYMNAGAYKSCYQDILEYADVLNDDGEVVRLSNEDFHFAYRTSVLQNHPNWIVLSAKFKLTRKPSEEVLGVIESRKARRLASQPLDKPSAGSVFRNPESISAWQLIDECGLRGYSIGGAKVSDKHSNFIVNEHHASSKDILDLITYVQKTVLEKKGIYLHKEVILVNWE